ncbi:hypothetical protein, partial [Paraburkholderia sabiae]|uniref:hypothetical protein n=1 Tax=Paraburkholderia sabiae TaxID=273251 RepID=UPI001CC7DCEA
LKSGVLAFLQANGATLSSTRRSVQAIRFNTDPVCIAARHVTSYPGRLHVFKKSLPYADGVLRVGLLQDQLLDQHQLSISSNCCSALTLMMA